MSDNVGAIAMDSLISAAGHALATGDTLGALRRVALRDDPPALALRGIAMAQLGDFARARSLLRRAGRGFGAREAVARARCLVAEAEVALVSRDIHWSARTLDSAGAVLALHGDEVNAAYAQLLKGRLLLLVGKVDAAADALEGVEPTRLPASSRAVYELAHGAVALARLRIGHAREAMRRAEAAARAAGIASLCAEVATAQAALLAPAARVVRLGVARPVRLEEVEALFASDHLVLDGCRHALRAPGAAVDLLTRPVLFRLARTLAEAWPGDAAREALAHSGFGLRHLDESVRARLRVEIGRLRLAVRPVAAIQATGRGFAIVPRDGRKVSVLAPLAEDPDAAIAALLADGEAWSSSALALALGISQRTVQRTLEDLATREAVRAIGAGSSRRWLAGGPHPIATALLLPSAATSR